MELALYRNIDFQHAKVGDKIIDIPSKSSLQALDDDSLQDTLEQMEDELYFDIIITDETIWYDTNFSDETRQHPHVTYEDMLQVLSNLQSQRDHVDDHIGFELIKKSSSSFEPSEAEGTGKIIKTIVSQTIEDMEKDDRLYVHTPMTDFPTAVCSRLKDLQRNNVLVLFVSNNQSLLSQVQDIFPSPEDTDPLIWCCRGDDIIGLTKCIADIKSIQKERENGMRHKNRNQRKGIREKSDWDKTKTPKGGRSNNQWGYKKPKKKWKNNTEPHVLTRDDQNWIDKLGISISLSQLIVFVVLAIGIISSTVLVWRCSADKDATEAITQTPDFSGHYTYHEIQGGQSRNIQSALVTFSDPVYLLWVMESGNEQHHKFWVTSGDTLQSETLGTGIFQHDSSGHLTLTFTKDGQQFQLQKTSK